MSGVDSNLCRDRVWTDTFISLESTPFVGHDADYLAV